MSQLQWKDEYSVRVSEIDHQHKKLIKLLNSLNDAMKEGRGKQVLDSVLAELFSYSEEHFQTEEKIFQQHQYPDTAPHIAQHDEFRKKVADLKMKFQAGNLMVTVDLLNFLNSWVEHHILEIDMKYSDFFVSKGLS